MPNHVENRITSTDPCVLDCLKGLLVVEETEGLRVDFERLIPKPPELVQSNINTMTTGLAELVLGLVDLHPVRPSTDDVFKDPAAMKAMSKSLHLSNVIRDLKNGGVSKLSDADFEDFVNQLRSYRACKALNWYDWSVEHWGTKWNAYECRVDDAGIRFQTAWSCPSGVVEALSLVMPGPWLWEFADEDLGNNLGVIVCDEGDIQLTTAIHEPLAFACEMHGYGVLSCRDHGPYADYENDGSGQCGECEEAS